MSRQTEKLLGELRSVAATLTLPEAIPAYRDAISRAIREIENLHAELTAVYGLLKDRNQDLARCPRHPKGQRCCLEAFHPGDCKWGSGD